MIKYVNGDIFTTDADIIIHQVNCQGVMGGGVALQVKNKYPEVFRQYKQYCNMHINNLGDVLVVPVDKSRQIANFFAQDQYGYGRCYTSYDAFEKCLLFMKTYYHDYSMAIPYLIGCNRGGGDWQVVSKMIEDILGDCDVTIYRYDLG